MTSVLGVTLAAGALVAAEAQTKDDFAYWDANGNGDLTCTEAPRPRRGIETSGPIVITGTAPA